MAFCGVLQLSNWLCQAAGPNLVTGCARTCKSRDPIVRRQIRRSIRGFGTISTISAYSLFVRLSAALDGLDDAFLM